MAAGNLLLRDASDMVDRVSRPVTRDGFHQRGHEADDEEVHAEHVTHPNRTRPQACGFPAGIITDCPIDIYS